MTPADEESQKEYGGSGYWMPEMKMKVKEISLVKSEFTKSGMKYTVIGEAACVKG